MNLRIHRKPANETDPKVTLLDLVVQFAPGQHVGFVRLLSIQDRLSEIFEGRSVDMHTLREIHPVILRQVQQQMVSIFPLEVQA